MKKYMPILKSVPAVGFIAMALAGCAKQSPEEDFCRKEAECGALPEGQTVQQCVTTIRGDLADLPKKPACSAIVDSYQDLLSCMSDLTCKELTHGDDSFFVPQDGSCREETSAFLLAVEKGEKECNPDVE